MRPSAPLKSSYIITGLPELCAADWRRATCLLLATAAFAEDAASTESTPKSASLLLPQNEADYSNFLTSLMDSQHKMLTAIHGVDSPQVALSSTLLDLQGSVSARPPAISASIFPCASSITTALTTTPVILGAMH